jgi:hypothetical protein
VFDCLREANVRLSKFPQLSLWLAICLIVRFSVTHSNADCEEALAILDRIIASSHLYTNDARNPLQEEASRWITKLAAARFMAFNKTEYLEAISRHRTYLSSASLDNPLRSELSQLLTIHHHEFGMGGDQEGRSSDPQIVDLSTFSSLTASLTEPNSSPITNEQWEQHSRALRSLTCITDIAEMEEAIEYCRLLVASVRRDPSHPSAFRPFLELGDLSPARLRVLTKSSTSMIQFSYVVTGSRH